MRQRESSLDRAAALLGAVSLALLTVSHAQDSSMNSLAEQYVRLVLAVGQHDADYVDAYYGPPEWRKEAEAQKLPLTEIASRAATLSREIADIPPAPAGDEMAQLRRQYLTRQLEALRARVSMLTGTRLRFDEESKALYDATAPTHTEADFANVLAQLESKLPGNGPLIDRYDAFRSRFVIPRERLDAVFKAAIDGCRSRTLQHITLPPGESFTVEYVTGKSWSGYNWYQGNYRSLIQVNTDLPIYVDRAIDLACHEGYPGHHVYNVLLEQHLLKERGWIEFSVYALFSPQSLIAEGSANYGIDVAFPDAAKYMREVLFPLAGMKPERAELYARVEKLTSKLDYAGNEASRGYLDGHLTREQARDYLVRNRLVSPERATKLITSADVMRSYVINYNLGRDMVEAF